ncbi:Hypothetical predicted protein [Paramuricea clavata]|uniref:Uncharacterized protein n=1 Tax=Paramuricea clavata TaxID=317549 RepID=A0A6S7I9G2_PARCT|nr:Hypothetical predicted protein [Paramuricea clavata]
MFYCRYCLHGFIREDLLQEHDPHWCRHGAQRIELPNEDNTSLHFKDYHKQLKAPVVIYADIESITVKIDSVSSNPTKSFTEKYQHHQLCGFSYVVVSEAEKYKKPPVVYRGDDTMGKYRGAAHNECNLNYSFAGRIPIILHNLRGYDSHLIVQAIEKLNFIDSPQFMNASLERLVSNLSKSGVDMFPTLQKHTEADKLPLLLRKGVNSYDYMDSFENSDEETLPLYLALGMEMKVETHGIPIQEFVVLGPKMYSILYTENSKLVEKKTAKGVKKSVTNKKIRHDDYKTCLFNKKQTKASMNQI